MSLLEEERYIPFRLPTVFIIINHMLFSEDRLNDTVESRSNGPALNRIPPITNKFLGAFESDGVELNCTLKATRIYRHQKTRYLCIRLNKSVSEVTDAVTQDSFISHSAITSPMSPVRRTVTV